MSNKMALDALTEFDEALTTWANAYPESVFPAPDLAKAAKLLEAGGMTLDAISADAMRHIAKTMHADFADCRAAIAALQAEPQGWMPIETAPKDGRSMLLGYPNRAGKWRTVRGQWFSDAEIAETWEEEGAEGWYETSVECEDLPNCWSIEPTHWMPLPAAPPKD